ncbi:Nn.00g005920.m01.CDS01 [Neocucurbitaria sp. VM-36]
MRVGNVKAGTTALDDTQYCVSIVATYETVEVMFRALSEMPALNDARAQQHAQTLRECIELDQNLQQDYKVTRPHLYAFVASWEGILVILWKCNYCLAKVIS